MSEQKAAVSEISRGVQWFSLLGGAIAWMLHLLLTYTISEWGCVQWPPSFAILGITVTAWLLILVSVILIAVAAAATWYGLRHERRADRGSRGKAEGGYLDWPVPSDRFVARTGGVMSAFFTFFIVVESIPTFYFLQHCGG